MPHESQTKCGTGTHSKGLLERSFTMHDPFFAWKDEHLIGTYSTLKEAVEALKLKERRRKRER
jgi:hypothetical protein